MPLSRQPANPRIMDLERFARIILGYHGAKAGDAAEFARRLLLGEVGIDEWKPSENEFDWLGHGIYYLFLGAFSRKSPSPGRAGRYRYRRSDSAWQLS